MIDMLKTPFWARRATILIAVLIGFVTLIPAQQLPNAPGSDKLHHVIAFAALVIPMCYAKPHQFWKYALFGAAFGAFIEIAQPLVNRSGEASAPKLQAAILDGRQPADLSLARLLREGIPVDWSEQARLFAQV